jgi:hypothetical protein
MTGEHLTDDRLGTYERPAEHAAGPGTSSAAGAGAWGLPPVPHLVVASLGLVVVGGIVLASAMPGRPPLPAAWGLLGGGVGLWLVAAVSLARVRRFAWWRFRQVSGYALAAYVVIAGMLEYVFVLDHVRGATLAVLTSMLVLFALDVPTLLAFTVARYEDPAGPDAPRPAPDARPGAARHA